ncbi:hypothetical protein ONZ45_g16402 [Pleurotus djamor]|nr:hypothetical protein ONZ45_g16402 [Pleurotus djamor]
MSPSTPKRASQRIPNMKQGVLGFTSSKRTASAVNSKSKKGVPRTMSAPARHTPDPIEDVESSTSSSSEDLVEEEIDSDEYVPTPKQRSAHAKEVKKESQSIIKKGVFRSSNSFDVDSRSTEKNALPADLADSDGRWRSHFSKVQNDMGHLPPIYAEDESKISQILRVFDLTYTYGPCAGVSRIDRWKRAKAMGLNPPKEVYEILTTKSASEDPAYSQSVFNRYEV